MYRPTEKDPFIPKAEALDNVQLIDTLLRLANDDLKTSRLTYERKLYPISVFHLQQSVEKAAKAFAVWSAPTDSANLKQEVGHNSVRVFIKPLVDTSNAMELFHYLSTINPAAAEDDFFKNLSSTLAVQNQQTKKAVELLRNLKNLRLENIDIDSLDDILYEIGSFQLHGAEKLKINKGDLNKYREQMTKVMGFLEKLDQKQADELRRALGELEASGALKATMRKAIDIYPSLIYLTFALFYLSVILFPHPVESRYPDQKSNFDPYIRYSSNYPIVVRMNRIQTIVGKALFRFRKLRRSM